MFFQNDIEEIESEDIVEEEIVFQSDIEEKESEDIVEQETVLQIDIEEKNVCKEEKTAMNTVSDAINCKSKKHTRRKTV